MIVNGSPVEFTQQEILTASVFLQVRVSEILNLSYKIYAVSEGELRLIRMHNPRRFGDYCCYFNDTTYITTSFISTNTKVRLLVTAFLLANDDSSSIQQLLNSLENYVSQMAYIEAEVISHQRTIQDYYQALANFTGYKKWDIIAFIKAARKYKALAEVIDDKLAITFKNVRCGNETEGYIQYKSIQLFLSDGNRQPYRAIYTFNNFFWDTEWSLSQYHFHPHLNAGTLCFGNRMDDYVLYATSRAYSFMIEILKDSVNNYSPDGPPYCNVTSIRQRIAVFSKIIDVNLSKDKHKSLREVNDITRYLDGLLQSNRCRHCGSLIIDRECSHETCNANPHYTSNCGRCGLPLTLGRWLESRHLYERTCNNTNCASSPNYVNRVDTPYCRVCGSLTLGDSLQCIVAGCRGSRYRQWERNSSDGTFNAVSNIAMITPQQAEELRATASVLAGTVMPAATVSGHVHSGTVVRYCPHCHEQLSQRNPTSSFTCRNTNCSRAGSWNYYRANGVWIDSAPYPRCPECGNELEYGDGEGFFCANDECDNYGSRLVHNDGSNAIPF